MPKVIKYGVFGSNEVVRADDGFIEVPVIIQESGLFAGAPPAELRIHAMGQHDDPEFNQAYVAFLNRRTDLPFYLGVARVQVIGELKKITDDDLKELNIEPLKDTVPQNQ